MDIQKNNFIIVSVIVIFVIIISYLGFARKDSINQTPKESIKIGATLALSGSLAYFGQAEANGFQMAVDEINNKGGVNGRNIELLIEDNAGDTKKAVSSVNKFLNSDKTDIIISAFTHITEAVKEAVVPANKLMFYISTFRGIAEENSLFFRDYFDAYDSGTAIAQSVVHQGYQRVGFLGEISTLCSEFEEAFNVASLDHGVEVVAEEIFNKEEKDLKTPLLKLKSLDPEAIVMCTWRQESIIMKQLKELDMMDIQTFHLAAPYLTSSDTEDMRMLFEENKTISSWYGFVELDVTEKQQDFARVYWERFGEKPNSDAMYAYDDMYILAQAMQWCDSENRLNEPTCLSERLLQTQYEGVAGQLSFNDKGVSDREVLVIEVFEGSWRLVR